METAAGQECSGETESGGLQAHPGCSGECVTLGIPCTQARHPL